MSDSAPDLMGKVLGFRQFRIEGRDLGSYGVSAKWMPGANHARCLEAENRSRSQWVMSWGTRPPGDMPVPSRSTGLTNGNATIGTLDPKETSRSRTPTYGKTSSGQSEQEMFRGVVSKDIQGTT